MTEELEKKLALLDFLEIDFFKNEDIYYYGEVLNYENGNVEVKEYQENNNPDCQECNKYLVLTDDEANEKWDESLNDYIENCILPELPKAYRNYFDDISWKADAENDGRGHSLSIYDGEEHEQDGYYIYRIN